MPEPREMGPDTVTQGAQDEEIPDATESTSKEEARRLLLKTPDAKLGFQLPLSAATLQSFHHLSLSLSSDLSSERERERERRKKVGGGSPEKNTISGPRRGPESRTRFADGVTIWNSEFYVFESG